jgi:hypothetical protein
MITFLEGRRVLFVDESIEGPQLVRSSLLEVRRNLTSDIQQLAERDRSSLRAMRAGCRRVLESVNDGGGIVSPTATITDTGRAGDCGGALGALRACSASTALASPPKTASTSRTISLESGPLAMPKTKPIPTPKTTEEDAAHAPSEGRPRAPGFTRSDSRKSFRLRGVDTERKGGFTAFILQRSSSLFDEGSGPRAATHARIASVHTRVLRRDESTATSHRGAFTGMEAPRGEVQASGLADVRARRVQGP